MARNFNGTTQYLSNTTNPFDGTFPFSTSAWFYHTGSTGEKVFFNISNNNASTPHYHTMRLYNGGTGNEIIWRCQNGAQNLWINVGTRTQDQWHHLGGAKNSGAGGVAFLDGGNKTTPGTSITGWGGDLTHESVGARFNSGADFHWEGYVAEVGLWDVVLDDAEFWALSRGYSPLLVRPESLIRYWPLMGRTSPEIERMAGNDLTLTNAPTVIVHPRIIYPEVKSLITPRMATGATMGRMYSVNNIVASVTAAIDLIEINAPSDAIVVLHSVDVTQETEFADAQSEMLDFLIQRASTSGAAGATPTAAPLEVGDAAFGGTVETGNTTQGTPGTVVHRETAHVASGFHWRPTPEERIVISPSGRIVVELGTLPDDSVDFRVNAIFEEIGG